MSSQSKRSAVRIRLCLQITIPEIDCCSVGKGNKKNSKETNRGIMKTRADPDTSGIRCAKLDLRYPTRLSAKVRISRITVYSILTVLFSLQAQSSWCRSSENCCPVNRLATTCYTPLYKLKLLRSLSDTHRVNPTQF